MPDKSPPQIKVNRWRRFADWDERPLRLLSADAVAGLALADFDLPVFAEPASPSMATR